MAANNESPRVLVIDDDEDLSTTIIDTLRDEGMAAWAVRPTPSSPGSAVVTTAALFRPHVILLDIVMPVDTARLVKKLRAARALRGASIIGCSGHAALAEGFMDDLDGFLHKPFTRAELLETLHEAVPADPRPARKSARRRPRVRAG